MTEQQIHLIPKLPGQTSDEIKLPTRQVFEYAYKNFTDSNVRKYLEDIQPWLYFRRLHIKQDYSILVLDHTGKQYTELINWTLQHIDALPANAKELHKIQSLKHKHPISVPIDTSKTSQTDKPTSTQTTTTTKPQSISIAQTIATAVHKDTGESSSPPPSPPTPHRNKTPTSSPDSSPDRMPSLRDRSVFFPQATFDGKDKSKTQNIYKALKIL